MLLLIVCVIILYFLFVHTSFLSRSIQKEGLTSKPTEAEKVQFTNEIIENKDYFTENGLKKLRNKLPWMDPILYEDVRKLHYGGALNQENVRNLL